MFKFKPCHEEKCKQQAVVNVIKSFAESLLFKKLLHFDAYLEGVFCLIVFSSDHHNVLSF